MYKLTLGPCCYLREGLYPSCWVLGPSGRSKMDVWHQNLAEASHFWHFQLSDRSCPFEQETILTAKSWISSLSIDLQYDF